MCARTPDQRYTSMSLVKSQIVVEELMNMHPHHRKCLLGNNNDLLDLKEAVALEVVVVVAVETSVEDEEVVVKVAEVVDKVAVVTGSNIPHNHKDNNTSHRTNSKIISLSNNSKHKIHTGFRAVAECKELVGLKVLTEAVIIITEVEAEEVIIIIEVAAVVIGASPIIIEAVDVNVCTNLAQKSNLMYNLC